MLTAFTAVGRRNMIVQPIPISYLSDPHRGLSASEMSKPTSSLKSRNNSFLNDTLPSQFSTTRQARKRKTLFTTVNFSSCSATVVLRRALERALRKCEVNTSSHHDLVTESKVMTSQWQLPSIALHTHTLTKGPARTQRRGGQVAPSPHLPEQGIEPYLLVYCIK